MAFTPISGLSPFTALPFDLQLRVSNYLPAYRDAFRLFQTCKHAYFQLQAESLLPRASLFVNIIIRAHQRNFNTAARFLEGRAKMLDPEGKGRRFEELFVELLQCNAHCTRVPMSVQGLDIIAMHCPAALAKIDFTATNISDAALFSMAKRGVPLEILELARCKGITDAGICAIARQCGKTLGALGLKETTISDVALTAIAQKCEALYELDLSGCGRLTDDGIQHIMMGCRGLKKLILAHCPINGSGLACVTGGASLERLVFAGSHIQREHLETIARRSPNLDTLGLRAVASANEALAVIMTHCTKLVDLSLSEVHQITSTHAEIIATHGTALESLFLSSCSLVSDEALGRVAQRCTALFKFDLSGTNASDATLSLIAAHCTQLTFLGCANCANVTDEGLHAVVSACARLEELKIGWTRVSKVGLAAIAELGVNMKKLSLGGLRVTTKDITQLERALPEMQIL